MAKLNKADDDTLSDVSAKESIYAELVKGADYRNARLLADTWCAAFIWKKDKSDSGRRCPTERTFRGIEDNPHSINIHLRAEVERIAQEYQFFHWHLTFPDVFRLPAEGTVATNEETAWDGGFDVVLGNPPWDKIELLEKEWFAASRPDIATASTAAKRKKLVAELEVEDPALFAKFIATARGVDSLRNFVRSSGLYPLCGVGRANTYSAFAEITSQLFNERGRTGSVLPSGIMTDDSTKEFVQSLLEKSRIIAFYDFDNRKGLFPTVQGNIKFCLLTLGVSVTDEFNVAAQLSDPSELSDPERRYSLTPKDVQQINPNTMNCPTFASRHDAALVLDIFRRLSVLHNEAAESNPWQLSFRQGLFNMTSDSHLFETLEELEEAGWSRLGNRFYKNDKHLLPLYEAKLAGQFDHRANTFDGIERKDRFKTHAGTVSSGEKEHRDPTFVVIPRYWVASGEVDSRTEVPQNFFLGFRNAISAVADSRSLVATAIPHAGVGNSMPLVFLKGFESKSPCFLGMLNSFVMDFVLRQKASGGNLNFYVFKQLPGLRPDDFDKASFWCNSQISNWIASRVLELSYSAWDLEEYGKECGYDGPPFQWDQERRRLMRCELDAAFFHMFLGPPAEWGNDNPQLVERFSTSRHAVDYIMDTFPIVKRKDIDANGEYRTKRVILEIYDEMTDATRTRQPYQTRLDPPPGPPAGSDGRFIPMAEWKASNWPSHVHQLRGVTT